MAKKIKINGKRYKTGSVPITPMKALDLASWNHFASAFTPGTLTTCECDAGPTHLSGEVPDTDGMRIHFHVDREREVTTLLTISGITPDS